MTKKKIDAKALGLGTQKLLSSGLTLDDAKILGIDLLSGEQTQRCHSAFKPLTSLRLNYFGVDGKPISDWPQCPPFYRIRYLEVGTDFADLAQKKPTRYVQEPNTAPVAYYPRNQEWGPIVDNVNEPLILTEGELKAAAACKAGFPTIGIGGVYSWRSHKLGLEWLPSLDLVRWPRRNVYIIYDSDFRTNSMVCSALHDLAQALHQRGALVHLVGLPQLNGLDKVGLDDFLVHEGPNAADHLARLLHEAEPLGLTAPLFDYNERYIYVRNPGLIAEQRTRNKISPSAFKDHYEAKASYQERQLKADGSISYKLVAAAPAWLKWPLRAEADMMTYAPGRELLVDGCFNLWLGWGVEPRAGDHKPFLQLLDHLFTGAEPGAKEWFLRWCAYPLQHPGTKLYSSALMHGIKHGTGKSLVGYTLGKIYGKNFTEIKQRDLHGGFNAWAESRQFVMGDDITGSNKREDNDLLKKMITQKTLWVNVKYLPSYEVPDCINYFFTANHPDAFFLEDDDRRTFIHEITVDPLEESFYVDYELWLETGGAAAVFDYLLKLDLDDFNPAGRAFGTAAKSRMIANVQSDLAAWVRQLKSAPETVLRVGDVPSELDLWTSKDLLMLYDPVGKTGTTANGLGRELARAGIRQVQDGRPIRLPDGSQARYYAVRGAETWLGASITQITQHLTGGKKVEKKQKY